MGGRRVVITGLGTINPVAIGVEDTWSGLLAGRCGIDTIKAFDPAGFTCRVAGEAPEFRIRDYVPKSHRKAMKLMCRDIELAIVAANEAIESSGLVSKAAGEDNVTLDPERTAINIGAGVISCDLVEIAPPVSKSVTDGKFDILKWGRVGLDQLTPLWLLKYLPNMAACHIGIIHDIQGPSNSITCGEASGIIAIGEAAQVIGRGSADAALAGGCEGKVNPLLMLRQCLLKRATSSNNDDPAGACRPFDADAKGSVFGEGAGMVMLEEFEGAKERGARMYAEVVGMGSSNDLSTVYERMESDGRGLEIAIEKALADAGISAGELDLIMPHGTGIAADDMAEAAAIGRVLGDEVGRVAVWPTKSVLSNTGAAGGAIDVVVAVRAMSEGVIGAARNCDRKAEGCKLNISAGEQKKEIRYAMCCGYTFGSQTAAIVLKNMDGQT